MSAVEWNRRRRLADLAQRLQTAPRPRTPFRPLGPAHKPPPDGIAPLNETPAAAGVWTVRRPKTGLSVECFSAAQLAQAEARREDISFYPYNPLHYPQELHMQITELVQKSKLPAVQAGLGTVNAFFQSQKQAISAVLPRHVTPERMLKLGLGAIRNNPALAECTVESLFGAVIKCAELGLEPNTPMGHVYLIPFNVRRDDKWQKDVQVIIGYRGYIDLARRSGQILKISAHEVRAGDDFEVEYGLAENLVHKPALDNRGAVIAYYAAARLTGGESQFEVMTPEQIDAIRDQSSGWQQALKHAKRGKDGAITDCNSPWFNHAVEMGRKTVVRRLMKYLPLSIELAAAQGLDDAADSNDGQHLGAVLQADYARESDPAPAPRALAAEPARAVPAPPLPLALADTWTMIKDEYESSGLEAAREALANVGEGRELIEPHLERLAQQTEAAPA